MPARAGSDADAGPLLRRPLRALPWTGLLAVAGCPPWTADWPPKIALPTSIEAGAETRWEGEGDEAWAGDTVADLGGVGGPEGPDLLIGAKGANCGRGVVYGVVDQETSGQRPVALARFHLRWGENLASTVDCDTVTGPLVEPGLGTDLAVLTDEGSARISLAIGGSKATLFGPNTGSVVVVTADPTALVGGLDLSGDPTSGLQTEIWAGGPNDERVGNRIDVAGDANLDGITDLAVGSHGGSAWVVFGPFGDAPLQLISDRAGILLKTGEWAGCSVAGLGDFFGTGYDVLAVGVCRNDVAADDAGAISLVELDGTLPELHGPLTDDAITEPPSYTLGTEDTVLYGHSPDDRLGFALEAAGDLDGDGYPDLLAASNTCGLDFPDEEGCHKVEGQPFGKASWSVVTRHGAPAGGGSWDIEAVASLRVEIDHNHTACDSAAAGYFLGDPDRPDLAIGVCQDMDGAVALLPDPKLQGQVLRVADEPDEVLLLPAEELGALAGAEIELVGEHLDTLVVGAWKADTSEGRDAGAVFLLPATAFER